MNAAVKNRIPGRTINRLTLYKRYLEYLLEMDSGNNYITSSELGEETHFNSAIVRRDLSCLGQLGQRKVGYKIDELCKTINKVLGLDKTWDVALIGVGNLGKALAVYRGFEKLGFKIVAIFDNDRFKIGKKWKGVKIQDMKYISKIVKQKRIKIAIIAVPFKAAQETADLLIKSGIKAILNLAPTRLTVPDGIKLRSIDLAVKLENLSHLLVRDR